MNLKDKNFLIVGASSGVGLELSTQLLKQGANLTVVSRSKPDSDAHYIPLDVTQDQIDPNLLPEVLHGLAYCVGSITLKPFSRLKKEDFLLDFQLNVLGAVQIIQAAFPALKKANGASIVLYSTVAVSVGMNFHASIAVAKGGIEALTKSLAAEFASSQIRVNAVAPSLTDTPLAKNLLSTDEKRESSAKRHPLGKIGTAADIANLSRFLLSPDSSWITGQIIGADGGMGNLKPF
ncbi:MAG: SDR family oxidoreductase [Bacteroidetes bacterium]|nr:MAG: SDR family oxidoreductase [Bacteroidota bacterium]